MPPLGAPEKETAGTSQSSSGPLKKNESAGPPGSVAVPPGPPHSWYQICVTRCRSELMPVHRKLAPGAGAGIPPGPLPAVLGTVARQARYGAAAPPAGVCVPIVAVAQAMKPGYCPFTSACCPPAP